MFRILSSLLVVLVLAASVLPGCTRAGDRARENVLAPAIGLALPGLRSDVDWGLAQLGDAERASALAVADRFFGAAADPDRLGEAEALWPAVRGWAITGIDAKLAAGAVGPNVAESLRERVRNVDRAMSRAGVPPPR